MRSPLPQGLRVPAQGRGHALHLLQRPGGPPYPPAHAQSHRVGLRQHPPSSRQTKGCGSRLATLTMVYKPAAVAEKGWCRLNSHQLPTHVFAGDTFVDGELKTAASTRPAPSGNALSDAPVRHPTLDRHPQLLTVSHLARCMDATGRSRRAAHSRSYEVPAAFRRLTPCLQTLPSSQSGGPPAPASSW